MKKVLSFLITFVFVIILCSITVFAQPFNFEAESYILIDSKTGLVLYEYNSDKILYPASTTKIMTAILAFEKGDPDQIMTASKEAVYDIGKGGMNIGIMPGEEIRMENLLEAMLISSANEAANIIAENICESRQEFVDLMNEKARELGALNTHFKNPCGAHDDDHYTTAADLAKIASYAMKIQGFRDIVCKKSYQMPPTNKHSNWPELYSSNLLLRRMKSDLFEVNGIKTGYTGQAGQNLVSSAVNEEGMELIAIVLGVKNPDKAKKNTYQYCYELLEYGFKNFSLYKIVEANEKIKTIQVADAGEDGALELLAADTLECVLPNGESGQNSIKSREIIRPSIRAPINKGEVLGYMEYERNGIVLGRVNLIASRTIEKFIPEPPKKTPEKKSTTLKKVLITALIIILVFSVLRFILRRISRRRYIFRRRVRK
ncbi:MAG TPA: D-alanyl-D-alanine carboxypeptidase [Clostridiaceae bacterium]|nr:D-alanyl-D-alanine carboxypeptidase [Clostridiaceae bacterium]